MLCLGAEIVPKRSQCEHKPYLGGIQFTTLHFDVKRSFTKTRFRCNFCTDRSVQTSLGPFQKPFRYGTFHFQQRSGAVLLFQSRNCFESSVPVLTEALSGTLSATLRSTIRYSVNVAVKSVPWTLAEFYFNRGLQRPYTGTCTILQKTIKRFLCCLLFFLKVKHIN